MLVWDFSVSTAALGDKFKSYRVIHVSGQLVYATAHKFLTGSLEVFIGGKRLIRDTAHGFYEVAGLNSFRLSFHPEPGAWIQVSYIRDDS